MLLHISIQPETGLPIFPLKTSPPPRDTHLSWAKKVMCKIAKQGNIGTPVKYEIAHEDATALGSPWLLGRQRKMPKALGPHVLLKQGRRQTAPESPFESQSKPSIEMVYSEPCIELRRRPQLFLAGTGRTNLHLPGFDCGSFEKRPKPIDSWLYQHSHANLSRRQSP